MFNYIGEQIGVLYFWLWHDLLGLPKQITYLIIESMQKHEIWYVAVGSVCLSTAWALAVHLIVTR